MMILRPTRIASQLLLLLALSGTALPLELSEKDNGGNVSVSVGETISIRLPGNPTTGYAWEMTDIDRAMLAPAPEPEYSPDSALTGAGGVYTFRLNPVSNGITVVKLIYRRSWEKDIPPLKRFIMTVKVLHPESRAATTPRFRATNDPECDTMKSNWD